MQNNRELEISTGGSRKAVDWQRTSFLWSEYCDKLQTPIRGAETLEEYLALPKSKQDELKDVGGFVGGTFTGSRRKANAVEGRDLVTLDLDTIPPGQTDDILRRVDGLGVAAAVYSTRKHSDYAPRLRVILPLYETCAPDEYEPIARKIASLIGMEFCDPTTFEASRLMYWPSVCADAPYVCEVYDKPFCDGTKVLGLYDDWHDITKWPQVPGAEVIEKQRVTKQQDPTTKKGAIGAFCRTYTVLDAMAKFIPEAYTPTETPGRYTYAGGSTTGGAVLYENGQFLYSHHATDPCSGQLVNAWDLVRLHKFGELDDSALPGTPTNRLPSFTAMSDLAMSDQTVRAMIAQERYMTASEAFGQQTDVTDTDWMQSLAIDRTGNYERTIDNLLLILRNDERLKGKIAEDIFVGGTYVLGELPWTPGVTYRRRWTDVDDAGMRWYLERYYGMVAREKTYDALALIAQEVKINVVKDYLQSLRWDGIPRLDTMFVDYLGAENTAYTRAVTRKTFVAAVARAVTDTGVKFDNMPILIGPQGIGKSTLLATTGKDWFSDSLTSFEGKDAAEMLRGVWINEVGELTAMTRYETNAVKQFLSKTKDIYRPSYGRNTVEYPRRCVFIGTSNNVDILKDRTGNRRFWPIDCMRQTPTLSVWGDLPLATDQIWAEAYARFMLGETLFLNAEDEETAKAVQAQHEDPDDLEGVIAEFLEKEIPENWQDMTVNLRRAYLNGSGDLMPDGELPLTKRRQVCAREIAIECLAQRREDIDPRLIRRINELMRRMPGWTELRSVREYGPHGRQRGFERTGGS